MSKLHLKSYLSGSVLAESRFFTGLGGNQYPTANLSTSDQLCRPKISLQVKR